MRPMSYEQWQRKQLRHSFSTVGWVLLIYYLVMNLAVFAAAFVESVVGMVNQILAGSFTMTGSAAGEWGYILAVAVGLLILLIWKKPRYWREEIRAKGKPMTPGSFLCILCLFLSGQLLYQIVTTAAELTLNSFGLTMMEGLEAMSLGSDSFTMFLYAGILAPISEEILFRGLIQRTLMPYGKKFAVFCSAFAFGLFHGNLLQTPYAFLVGLVLGYTAAEYSIAWAMVLHMVNNLVIADMLTRLTAGMSELAAGMIISGIVFAFSVGAVIVVIKKRRQIEAYLHQERMNRLCLKCFFTSPGMVTLTVLMVISMVVTAFMLVTPL